MHRLNKITSIVHEGNARYTRNHLTNYKSTTYTMKTLLKKIDLINSMLDAVNDSADIPVTYAGGTWPYYVQIKPIEVKNQFVTIRPSDDMYFPIRYSYFETKERYNMNKKSICGDEYCAKHLNYTLNIILKAFKKATK